MIPAIFQPNKLYYLHIRTYPRGRHVYNYNAKFTASDCLLASSRLLEAGGVFEFLFIKSLIIEQFACDLCITKVTHQFNLLDKLISPDAAYLRLSHAPHHFPFSIPFSTFSIQRSLRIAWIPWINLWKKHNPRVRPVLSGSVGVHEVKSNLFIEIN